MATNQYNGTVPLIGSESIGPDFKSQEMLLNMGPQHPSTHGVLRLVLKLEGETVVDCTGHRGSTQSTIYSPLDGRDATYRQSPGRGGYLPR